MKTHEQMEVIYTDLAATLVTAERFGGTVALEAQLELDLSGTAV